MKSIRDIFRSYGVLDSDGRHINGTDKETNHNYGDAYEQLFKELKRRNNVPIHTGGYFCSECGSDYDYHNPGCSKAEWLSVRSSVRLMMEVGVADGSSLLAWREVFPNATIVGLDIHHSDRAHSDRIEFYLGDATTREACEHATAGRQFDVIIDDATHRLEDVLRTLFWLWPFVRPGGLYIVEDGGFQDCNRARILFGAEIVDTKNKWGGVEPLVVLRKR